MVSSHAAHLSCSIYMPWSGVEYVQCGVAVCLLDYLWHASMISSCAAHLLQAMLLCCALPILYPLAWRADADLTTSVRCVLPNRCALRLDLFVDSI